MRIVSIRGLQSGRGAHRHGQRGPDGQGVGCGERRGAAHAERASDTVNSAAYSPDGTRIVTASWDETAKVWDAESGEELLTLSGHTGLVCQRPTVRTGDRIVTASWDGTAKVWDAESGEELLTLSGHTDGVNSAATVRTGTASSRRV